MLRGVEPQSLCINGGREGRKVDPRRQESAFETDVVSGQFAGELCQVLSGPVVSGIIAQLSFLTHLQGIGTPPYGIGFSNKQIRLQCYQELVAGLVLHNDVHGNIVGEDFIL